MRISKLILVVPCYNESRRISLDVFERFLARHDGITVCFVDDGSTDSTHELLLGFVNRNEESSYLISMPKNSGKAEAVRHGVTEMLRIHPSCGYIGYWDADLATPLEQSLEFLSLIDGNPLVYAVVGSRWAHLGADIERGYVRNLIGVMMAAIIARYLRLNLYDSQCGAKMFRTDVAAEVFRVRFVSRWLFDVEIFKRMKQFLARRLNADEAVMMNMHCREIPLRSWREVPDSKLHFSDALGILSEMIRIAWRYRAGGSADVAGADGGARKTASPPRRRTPEPNGFVYNK